MSDTSFYGQAGLTSPNSEFTKIRFAIRQELAKHRSSIPVKVVSVQGGGVGAPPVLSVQPLINQIDGLGNSTPHGVVNGISVARNQGGGSAVINDPQPGDIGWMSISDRDMSALVAANGAQSNPGSYRRASLSDGVYTGAILNQAAPKQYLYFNNTAGGVTLVDQFGNKIITENGKVAVVPGSGNIVFLGGDGVTGSYDWVVTNSGPCTNFVKGRYA